jgi:hypothetical protein
MNASPSNDPLELGKTDRRRRSPLGFDEAIAVFLAFGTIGGLLGWTMLRSKISPVSWIQSTVPVQATVTMPPAPTIVVDPTAVNPTPVAIAPPEIAAPRPTVKPAEVQGPNFAGPGLGLAAAGAAAGVATLPTGAQAAAPTPSPATAEVPMVVEATPIATVAAATPTVIAATPAVTAAATATAAAVTAAATPVAIATPVAPPASVPPGSVVFKDVKQEEWVAPFVQAMAGKKLVEGLADGTFRGDRPVTRAEFALMLSQALDLEGEAKSLKFKDIATDTLVAKDIAGAVNAGYMRGYAEGDFKPMQEIPRWQVLVALASGMKLDAAGDPASVLARFTDGGQMPKYALPKAASATQFGLVVVAPKATELLEPNRPATRAEAIAMIHQVLVQQGKLQPVTSDVLVKP